MEPVAQQEPRHHSYVHRFKHRRTAFQKKHASLNQHKSKMALGLPHRSHIVAATRGNYVTRKIFLARNGHDTQLLVTLSAQIDASQAVPVIASS